MRGTRIPITLLGYLLLVCTLAAQEPVTTRSAEKKPDEPAKKEAKDKDDEKKESRSPVVVYRVKRAVTISGEPIDDAVVLVQDGKIKAIGKHGEVEIPPYAEIVDRSDQTVAPGFVHPASLAYTGLTRATFSGGSLKGSATVTKRLDPSHEEASRLGREGFTTLAVMIPGGGVAGQGALVKPVKKGKGLLPVKDILREEKALLWMAFEPKTSTKKFWKETLEKARKYLTDLAAWEKSGGKTEDKKEKPKKADPPKKPDAKKEEKGKEAKKKPGDKKEEAKPKKDDKKADKKSSKKSTSKPSEPKKNPALMPLIDVLEKRLPGILVLSDAKSVLHFEKILDQEKAFRPAILMGVGGSSGFSRFRGMGESSSAWRVAERLLELKVAVIMPASLGVVPFTNATRVTQRVLLDKGIPMALIPSGSSKDGYRGFRFQLNQLVRHGIPREQVLRAVTLAPAEILGIQDRCGSLDAGKSADIVFYSGDPLSPATQIISVLVDGKSVYDAGEENS